MPLTDEEKREDKDIKNTIGKPTFLKCSENTVFGGYEQDSAGNWWAFFGGESIANNLYCADSSARLEITNDAIDVAIRARWADEPDSPVPAGEAVVLGTREWEEQSGKQRPIAGPYLCAVKLPFRPRYLRFVDA